MSINHGENIVEVKNVSFGYGDHLVLKNINLNIHRGDYLGVIGPNGGGKTTLIKIILGLMKPDSGEVIVSAKSVGYVAQKATNVDPLFPVTVFDIVAMGNDGKHVHQALKEVDLWEYSSKLIGDLSGGQQQRVFIARALAQRADIIFLDEPTSGIDTASQTQFYELLKKLNRNLGVTLVLISHDLDVISQEVTELACINQTLTYHGDPDEFMEKGTPVHHHH